MSQCKLLKSIRSKLGLTQLKLGKIAGVSQSMISACETRGKFLSYKACVRVVKYANKKNIKINIENLKPV